MQFIVPSYDADSLERTHRVISVRPKVLFPAFGIHPWYVTDRTDVDSLVVPYLSNHGAIAVGEIGLDLAPGCPPIEWQIPVFERQLTLAVEHNLPVIIHCRKAHQQLYPILQVFQGDLRGVMHSYSGSTDLMYKFLDLGLFIAFSGSVTRRTARKYHQNAKAVPFDRLLLETDAPSIATETTVASLVEPKHMVEIGEKVAELRDISYQEICVQSTRNAKLLFNLPPSPRP
jgi:TatD DNase family protein